LAGKKKTTSKPRRPRAPSGRKRPTKKEIASAHKTKRYKATRDKNQTIDHVLVREKLDVIDALDSIAERADFNRTLSKKLRDMVSDPDIFLIGLSSEQNRLISMSLAVEHAGNANDWKIVQTYYEMKLKEAEKAGDEDQAAKLREALSSMGSLEEKGKL